MNISIKSFFGLISSLNIILLPMQIAVLVRDYYFKYDPKIVMFHWGYFIGSLLLTFYSLYLYLHIIDFHTGEFYRRGRRAEITDGDVEILRLLRKPLAYVIQFLLIILNFNAIADILKINN